MTKKLIEGKDYQYNDEGHKVLSSSFLEQRGYCCKSGCSNCPYDYSKTADPSIPIELQAAWSDESEIAIYDGEIDEE